jgi:DNA-binding NarL/FixJ family response regulator
MKPITILLADDHMVVREGLRKLLELDAGLKVVGEAQDGHQAIALAKKFQPDVVLMDIAMPRLNGFEATRQILKVLPATKVLILSAYSDDEYVLHATRFGAVGFLLKQTSAHEMDQAIREVQQGKTVFSPSIAKHFDRLNLPLSVHAGGHQFLQLTSREMEVLQLIAEGRPNKQAAEELGISVKTVEKHRDHIISKLDIHDTAGLTRYAISAGIIESSAPLKATN